MQSSNVLGRSLPQFTTSGIARKLLQILPVLLLLLSAASAPFPHYSHQEPKQAYA